MCGWFDLTKVTLRGTLVQICAHLRISGRDEMDEGKNRSALC